MPRTTTLPSFSSLFPGTRGGRVRIAQVAPLFESVPPRRYGGTERVVSYLTEELVRQGHRVTLFATADSKTSAELVPVIDRPLRGDPHWLTHALVQLERVIDRAGDFDVLHFHTDHLHYPLLRYLEVPVVTTLHGRLDIPGLQPLHQVYSDAAVVSISEAQHGPLPEARWVGAVPPRPAARALPAGSGRRRLPGLRRSHLAREAPRPGRGDRPAGRPPAPCRGEGGSCRPEVLRTRDRATARHLGGRVPWRDRRPAEDGTPRETRSPSCFPSTGPSPSAW